MKLYKGTIHWYDDYQDKENKNVVYGFAEDMVGFVNKINRAVSDVYKLEVSIVNYMVNDNELLWVNPEDLTTQLAIEEENDY